MLKKLDRHDTVKALFFKLIINHVTSDHLVEKLVSTFSSFIKINSTVNNGSRCNYYIVEIPKACQNPPSKELVIYHE